MKSLDQFHLQENTFMINNKYMQMVYGKLINFNNNILRITLFDDPEDDLYDGDFQLDDEEYPRI